MDLDNESKAQKGGRTMPRIHARSRSEALRRMLFEKSKFRIPNSQIARLLGKANTTIANWKDDPEKMPFGAVITYVDAMGWSDEEWRQLRYAGKRGN